VFCLRDLVYKVSRKKQIQTTTVVVVVEVVVAAANEQEKNTVGQLAKKKYLVIGEKCDTVLQLQTQTIINDK